MLHDFLQFKRDDIIARARVKSATAAQAELAHGVPQFVDQLIGALRHSQRSRDEMMASATQHGDEMLRLGFTVAEVVYDYGNVCQAVTELALEHNETISVREFCALNACIDEAISQAVTEYERQREQSLSAEGRMRLGALAHELRNRLNTAMLSFGMLESGEVSIRVTATTLLHRSLNDLRDLIVRSSANVRPAPTVGRD